MKELLSWPPIDSASNKKRRNREIQQCFCVRLVFLTTSSLFPFFSLTLQDDIKRPVRTEEERCTWPWTVSRHKPHTVSEGRTNTDREACFYCTSFSEVSLICVEQSFYCLFQLRCSWFKKVIFCHSILALFLCSLINYLSFSEAWGQLSSATCWVELSKLPVHWQFFHRRTQAPSSLICSDCLSHCDLVYNRMSSHKGTVALIACCLSS